MITDIDRYTVPMQFFYNTAGRSTDIILRKY